MKTPHYDDTIHQPLTTDALVEQRVAALVGRACRRQLWFLFLDENQVQLPLIVPFGDPPARPDSSVPNLARLAADALEAEGGSSVIVVIERYADATLTSHDAEWARALHDALDEHRVPVRAILLSHRRGVRWIAQDDYRFAGS